MYWAYWYDSDSLIEKNMLFSKTNRLANVNKNRIINVNKNRIINVFNRYKCEILKLKINISSFRMMQDIISAYVI